MKEAFSDACALQYLWVPRTEQAKKQESDQTRESRADFAVKVNNTLALIDVTHRCNALKPRRQQPSFASGTRTSSMETPTS